LSTLVNSSLIELKSYSLLITLVENVQIKKNKKLFGNNVTLHILNDFYQSQHSYQLLKLFIRIIV